MTNAGAKLSAFPEVNDIQTGDMFPLLSGGNTNAKIDYATLANAIIAKEVERATAAENKLESEKADKTLATASADGLMSKSDKAKLDGIGAGSNVKSVNGKTGAVTLEKGDVGLGSVDNTKDADKPISTAVQTALDAKANNSVATESTDGLMSAADKTKLDGIDPSAITTNAANIKKNADEIAKLNSATLARAIITKLKSEDVVQTQTNNANKLISAALAYSMNQDILQLEEDTSTEQEEKSVTAGIVTVEDADGGDAGLTLNLEPYQSGSGDPSPENIRPISGYDAVNVVRAGKNLLSYPYRGAGNNLLAFTDNGDGTITADGTPTATGFYNLFTRANPLRLKAGTYRISATGNSNIQWNFYYTSGEALSTGSDERTFTLTSDEDVTSFLRYNANVQYQNVTIKPMLVLSPETDLTYEPYSEQTYSITFPTEAGTVYGGSLDVTSGKLVVDRVGVTISDLTWTYDSSNTRFTTSSITNVIQKPSADNVLLAGLMSSAYTARAATQLAANDGSIGVLSNGQLLIKDTNYTVASNFVSAMGAQSIVYPLATPRTYQLTPTEVTMLIGHNTIWMDADGRIKLDYKTNAIATKGNVNEAIARIKALAKITEAIAPVESSYTATQNYSVGDYLIVDYKLYRVTAVIANGGAITVGTNVTATTIMAEIKALA